MTNETISGYADPTDICVLTEIDGVQFPARATIAFSEPGRSRGEGPCNAYSDSQSAPYTWLAHRPIAATRRACPDLDNET